MRDVLENPDKTHKFHTTRRYPIYYMSITKCGSTYLKNLFYYLDNDRLHDHPDHIHDHSGDLMRAGDTPAWMIRRSEHAFTVLRRPSSRFLSLYFDKIYGDHPQNFPDLRQEIAEEAGLDLSRALDVAAHRENCRRFIGWLEKNLTHDTDAPINPHWRPQMRRVGTVMHLAPSLLTLDGLDRQLPIFLDGVVPDLPRKMAAVKSRNPAPYPVDPGEVMTGDLEDAVNAVYSEDWETYSRVSRRWQKAEMRRELASPAVATEDVPKIGVIGSHRFNLNTIAQPKAGISYVRNIHYALDHGRMHPEPVHIERDGCLVQRQKSVAEMQDGIRLLVLRDPVRRFFSLYFDKVWSESETSFPWIPEKLQRNRRFSSKADISVDEHHDNCCRLLGYLETRFKERPTADLNRHWRPQTVRAREAARFGFTPVLLERFAEQVTEIAGKRLRSLPIALDVVDYRNESKKPVPVDELVSPWITDRLHALYGDDIALYERVRAGWEDGDAPPEL